MAVFIEKHLVKWILNYFFQIVTVAVARPARLVIAAIAAALAVIAARSSSAKMHDKRRNYQIFTII